MGIVRAGATPEETEADVAVAAEALVEGDREIEPGTARAALRYPVFRRLFIGAFLSNIGTWMQNVVLGALAYDLTGSSTFVGVIVFAQLGPFLLLSVVGGVLVDSVDRRKLIGGIASTQLVLSFVLAAAVAPDEPNKVLLVGLVFAIGIGQALFAPAYAATLPQLVDKEDMPGAISLNSVQMNGSRVIGPVIGAGLDALFGAPGVFVANGISYLFIIGAILTLELPPPVVSDGVERGWRRFTSGFAIARRDVIVRRCLFTVVTFSLISLTFVGQFPVIADRNMGVDERSGAYGALYACLGLGGVLGALAVGTVLHRIPKPRIVRVSLVAFAVALTLFAAVRSPGPGYPAALALGFTYFCMLTSLATVIQEQVTHAERGRITALWIMGFGGMVPLGNLVAGPVIELTSVTTVMLVGAAWGLVLAGYARLGGARTSRPAVDPKLG